jgi:hypothetical protein
MVWVDRRVRGGALVVLAWLFSIEFYAARKWLRAATEAADVDEQVVDTATSRWRCGPSLISGRIGVGRRY